MTRVATLFQTPLVQVERFDHPQNEVHVDGQLEVVPAHRITFLRSGQFRIVRETGEWDFAPGDVLFSSPGIAQRVFHPVGGARDECLSIRFEKDLIEDALGRLATQNEAPKVCASARTAFQGGMIAHAIESSDPMMAESVALAAAQIFRSRERNFLTWSSIERAYGWYQLRVQRICDLLIQEYASEHNLTHLASVAQMSPFHLNRVFHYLVGVPLHQYVIRLRLAAAARAIRNGQSATEAAYANGFNSVSFFSRSFSKHFGIAPKRYRELKRFGRHGRSATPDLNSVKLAMCVRGEWIC
jgi:AraC-like DNA-binding protein